VRESNCWAAHATQEALPLASAPAEITAAPE
jgi:hypothetical protein